MSKQDTKHTDEKPEKPAGANASQGAEASKSSATSAADSSELAAQLAQAKAENEQMKADKQAMEDAIKEKEAKLAMLESANNQKLRAEEETKAKADAAKMADTYAKPGKMVRVASKTDYTYNIDGVIVDKVPKTLLRYTGNYLDSQIVAGNIEEI